MQLIELVSVKNGVKNYFKYICIKNTVFGTFLMDQNHCKVLAVI
jgi:hypothetical protein